jgi:hypothetical protein
MRPNLAALMSARFVLQVNMVRSLVLHAKPWDAIIPAAEYRLVLAPLVLASLVPYVNMVLVLVLLAEKRGTALAPEISVDLTSFLLAVSVEPRSAYERSDLQRQRPESSQSTRSRDTIDADEGAGS